MNLHSLHANTVSMFVCLLFFPSTLPPDLLLQKLIRTENQVHSNSIYHCVQANSSYQQSNNISSRCNQIITSWIKMISRQTITWKPIKPLQPHSFFSLPILSPLSSDCLSMCSSPFPSSSSCLYSACTSTITSHFSLPSSSSSLLYSVPSVPLLPQLRATAAGQGQREVSSVWLSSKYIHLDFM